MGTGRGGSGFLCAPPRLEALLGLSRAHGNLSLAPGVPVRGRKQDWSSPMGQPGSAITSGTGWPVAHIHPKPAPLLFHYIITSHNPDITGRGGRGNNCLSNEFPLPSRAGRVLCPCCHPPSLVLAGRISLGFSITTTGPAPDNWPLINSSMYYTTSQDLSRNPMISQRLVQCQPIVTQKFLKEQRPATPKSHKHHTRQV